MSSPRKALMFTLEHEDSAITIMKPMTPQGVSTNYGVDLQEIELFIGERKTEKF